MNGRMIEYNAFRRFISARRFELAIAAIVAGMLVLGQGLRAQAADGGTIDATSIGTIRIEATGQRFEPLHNVVPLGPPKHVSDYKIIVTWNPAAGRAREEWALETYYPFPRKLTFSVDYDGDRGQRAGRDGFRPSTEGPVPPARIGAVFKDLWLSNPTVLMAFSGKAPNKRGKLEAQGATWQLEFDPETGLPISVTTIETDPLEGSVTNSIVFSDWQEVGGIPFPFKLEQFIDGRLLRRETRQSITVNGQNAALKNLAETGTSDKAEQARGFSMSHFYLRRAVMGAPADKDESLVVSFHEIGPGLYQVRGSSHLNLIIEGPDGLAIADAVWYPKRSRAILAEIAKRWPTKPLKYVILTHHHPDHTGGLSSFTEAGATVVLGSGNESFFRAALDKTGQKKAKIIAVEGRATLDGIGRAIEVYDIPNSHADALVAIYVPDAKTLYNTDLYSPGRPTQKRLWASELLRAVEFYGLDVETHAGGHGFGTKPHDDLVASSRAPE